MATRVTECGRSEREGGTDYPHSGSVTEGTRSRKNASVRTDMEKCAACEKLKQQLQNKDKEMQDLEKNLKAHFNMLNQEKEEKKKIKKELKQRKSEIKRLESEYCTKPSCLAMLSELTEKKTEIADLRSEPCHKTSCVEKEMKCKEMEEQLIQLQSGPCTKRRCMEITSGYEDLRTECSQIQLRLLESQQEAAEQKRLRSELQQKLDTMKSQQKRLQVENDQLTEQVERQQTDLQQMQKGNKEDKERLESLTCKAQDCPSQYLQILRSEIIGTGVEGITDQPGQRVTLSVVVQQILRGQQQILLQLQPQLLEQQQKQSCANCSEMAMKYRGLQDAYHQLQKQNQEWKEDKKRDEEAIQRLQRQLFSSSEQCQRPACVKLRRQQRQKEVQTMGNIGKDMDKQWVVEHDHILHEFGKLTTDQDGLLGLLESTLKCDNANFEAKRLLCTLFQEAYDRSKKVVIRIISTNLQSLFTLQSKTEELEDASRGYGLLLHAFSLRGEEIRAQYSQVIKAELFDEFSGDNDTFQKVKQTLENGPEDLLGKAIELAWRFVTLPNPLIVCQPKTFDERIHSQEYGYWNNKKHTSNLIYTRPVVYRNYAGTLACRGWVANEVTGKHSQQQTMCLLS